MDGAMGFEATLALAAPGQSLGCEKWLENARRGGGRLSSNLHAVVLEHFKRCARCSPANSCSLCTAWMLGRSSRELVEPVGSSPLRRGCLTALPGERPRVAARTRVPTLPTAVYTGFWEDLECTQELFVLVG